jgi:NodT family efflux transporter outer membrane factor (OMF) lipoprotein
MTQKLFLIPVIFMMTACSIGPAYQTPAVETPDHWKDGSVTASLEDKNWWEKFNTPELTTLINQALAYNTDLAASLARIDQARAQVKIARGSLFPSVSASGNMSRTNSDYDSHDTSYNAQLSVAYELDLWQRNANTKNIADYQLKSSVFDRDALELVVTSSTAQTYFTALILKERIRLTEESIKVFKETSGVIEARYKEGSASGLELSQQRTTLANAEASLAALTQQMTNAENALAVLIGKAPQDFKLDLPSDPEKVSIPQVQPSMPSELLTRRPDIRSLEEGLKAAHANVAVARTNIFPSITIGGSTSLAASSLSSSPEFAVNALASVAQRIFEGGRITGEVDLAKAQQQELVANYRTGVLTAFKETEDALAAITAATERENKLTTALNESRNYYKIAKDRYLNGADDFLTLLDAQRTLLTAQDNYAQAKFDQLNGAIGLFKALGGGWKSQ